MPYLSLEVQVEIQNALVVDTGRGVCRSATPSQSSAPRRPSDSVAQWDTVTSRTGIIFKIWLADDSHSLFMHKRGEADA